MDAMRISRGLFVLAIVGAAALGYAADRLRNSYLSPYKSVPSNSSLPSRLYYLVTPNTEALIDHKKVSANPTQAEWESSSLLPMTREQCEAELKKRSELRIAMSGEEGQPERNVQIDVTNLRRCVPVDAWDSVEKYSPDPKDVFRP